jgi:glycosyltransferase involved in cell wall biosynthesis
MKILFLSDYVAIDHKGGATTVLLQALAGLRALGHEVRLICGGPDHEADPALGVTSVPYAGRSGGVKGMWQAHRRFKSPIRAAVHDWHPDVTHGHQPFSLGACPRTPIPVVYTFHSSWADETAAAGAGNASPGVWVRRRFEARVFRKVGVFVVLSRFMRDCLKGLLGDTATIRVIPGALPAPEARGSARPIPGEYIACVRRLVPRTGVDLAIQAVAKLSRPDLELVVIGDGPLRESLEVGAPGNVRFTGYVPDAELDAWLTHAACSIIPTRELEGFGMSTLESLLRGVPVVATPVGGNVEILQDLFAEGLAADASADALKTALERVLALEVDRRDLARATLDRYPPGQRSLQLERLYRDLR